MKCGRVQAEDLHVIIIFFENIVERTLENPYNLAENPLENPGKEFHFTVGHTSYMSSYKINEAEIKQKLRIFKKLRQAEFQTITIKNCFYKQIRIDIHYMPHKTWASFSLQHGCLPWVVTLCSFYKNT